MKKLLVMNVRASVMEENEYCLPGGPDSIVEVKFRDEEGNEFYISNADFGEIANFYRTEQSTFDKQMQVEDIDGSEEFYSYLNEHMCAGEYEDIFTERDPDWFDAYRYVVYLSRCSKKEDISAFIKNTVGKWLDGGDIPVSDIEKKYLCDCGGGDK